MKHRIATIILGAATLIESLRWPEAVANQCRFRCPHPLERSWSARAAERNRK